jgi:hypothetical protein
MELRQEKSLSLLLLLVQLKSFPNVKKISQCGHTVWQQKGFIIYKKCGLTAQGRYHAMIFSKRGSTSRGLTFSFDIF